MKRLSKLTYIASILLLLIFTAGCSDQYQSERYLYKATRLAKDVFINPEAIPPQQFERAIKAYEIIFEKYPKMWTARRARIAIGTLYLAKEEYEKARSVFRKAIELYPDDTGICIEARFATGKSYEKENLWNRALQEYMKIIADYPDTEMALSLPMYIASKDKDYGPAIAHYKNIAQKNPNSQLGFRALNFVSICYTKKGDWAQVVRSMEKLAMDYPMAANVGLTLRTIADISVRRLNQPGLVTEIFGEFLKKYPDHPLKKGLEKALGDFENISSGK